MPRRARSYPYNRRELGLKEMYWFICAVCCNFSSFAKWTPTERLPNSSSAAPGTISCKNFVIQYIMYLLYIRCTTLQYMIRVLNTSTISIGLFSCLLKNEECMRMEDIITMIEQQGDSIALIFLEGTRTVYCLLVYSNAYVIIYPLFSKSLLLTVLLIRSLHSPLN